MTVPTTSDNVVACACGHLVAAHTLLDGRRCYQPGCSCLSLRVLPATADQEFAQRHGRPDPAWQSPRPPAAATRPRTQRERVLSALRRAGERGVTAHDFYAVVIDGGPRISRFAARVHELRQDGHLIEVRGRRAGHDVFVLRQPQPAVAAPVDQGRLFTPAAPGAYDRDR